MIGVSIFSVIVIIAMAFGWGIHVTMKEDKIDELRKALNIAKRRLEHAQKEVNTHERVPLRAKCRCKHDAYEHDERGCQNWWPFFGYCSCLASQEQVMFEPDPMKKMLLL